MKNAQLIEMLIEAGATHEKKENEQGETKSGWWMDTTFLAPYRMPDLALKRLKG